MIPQLESLLRDASCLLFDYRRSELSVNLGGSYYKGQINTKSEIDQLKSVLSRNPAVDFKIRLTVSLCGDYSRQWNECLTLSLELIRSVEVLQLCFLSSSEFGSESPLEGLTAALYKKLLTAASRSAVRMELLSEWESGKISLPPLTWMLCSDLANSVQMVTLKELSYNAQTDESKRSGELAQMLQEVARRCPNVSLVKAIFVVGEDFMRFRVNHETSLEKGTGWLLHQLRLPNGATNGQKLRGESHDFKPQSSPIQISDV